MRKLFSVLALLLVVLLCYTGAFGQIVIWPLGPQGSAHQVWNAYGEYSGSLGTPPRIHFHEGIDLPVDSGTVVLASAPGCIVEKHVDGSTYNHYLTIGVGDTVFPTAWGYVHLDVGAHPVHAREWQVGDIVVWGDTLGTVAAYAGILPHLHFEYDNDDNGWSPNGATTCDLNGNPLEHLIPNPDGVSPEVLLPFHYRPQSGEGNSTASYFHERTASDLVVVKDNVDVIARAYERLGNWPPLDYDLNVSKIEFMATEVNGPAWIDYQQAEHFSGLFLQAPDGRNSFAKFRDSTRVKVIFENDNTCRSVFADVSGATNNAEFYYILTNIDDDYDLEVSDTSRYWDTDGKDGEPWNDDRDSTDHEAEDNADAAFPDGQYQIFVRAWGQSPDDPQMKSELIFVNNHDESIESCDDAGSTKDYFKPREKVYVRGEGFPRSRSFDVHLVRNTDWSDGMAISGIITTTEVTTTDSGTIDPTQVWDEYMPNGKPDQGYDMVIDYDDDVKYTASKEGFIVEALDDADVEYNAGLRSKEPKVVVTTAGHTHLRLTWTEPWDSLGIQRYIIQRSLDPASPGDTLNFTSDTTYIDYYVTGNPYYNYFYIVSAENLVGEQVWVSDMVGEFDKQMLKGMK